jgi:hypothetical protein
LVVDVDVLVPPTPVVEAGLVVDVREPPADVPGQVVSTLVIVTVLVAYAAATSLLRRGLPRSISLGWRAEVKDERKNRTVKVMSTIMTGVRRVTSTNTGEE